MDTEYGTVAERVDRGTEVLRAHGVTLDQLSAGRFSIEDGYDCALGQAYDILHPDGEAPGVHGYHVLRDKWSQESGVATDAVDWANYNGFSPSRAGGTVALTQEWRTRIRAARAAAAA